MKIKDELEVFAALHEDSNAGWVWLPSFEHKLRSRDFIKLTYGKDSVICVARTIDDNFLAHYKRDRTFSITNSDHTIVISEYYRGKLDDIQTNKKYSFEITRIMKYDVFSKIRALLQHPDNINKVVGWLAIISIGLSAIGVILSFYSLLTQHCY